MHLIFINVLLFYFVFLQWHQHHHHHLHHQLVWHMKCRDWSFVCFWRLHWYWKNWEKCTALELSVATNSYFSGLEIHIFCFQSTNWKVSQKVSIHVMMTVLQCCEYSSMMVIDSPVLPHRPGENGFSPWLAHSSLQCAIKFHWYIKEHKLHLSTQHHSVFNSNKSKFDHR